MITTRRNGNSVRESYDSTGSNVGVLDREMPSSYAEYTTETTPQQDMDVARERMQENLQRLLNYDRYTEEVASAQVVDAPVQQQELVQAVSEEQAEEDIRPTSTTMQFGDADLDQMYQEMNSAVSDEEDENYKLNGKGKLTIVLYSLVVAVIMALIVLNTGVLARLNATNQAKASELDALVNEYTLQQQQIESVSNNDYIIDQAQNMGMVKD